MACSVALMDVEDKVDGKELDLSLMQLSKVPVKEISNFPKVNSLDLSCNQITQLPDNFCSALRQLIKLDLSKNKISKLPHDIFRLRSLQHLDLFSNEIKELPVTFSHMKSLRWLDLKDNPLRSDLVNVVGGCLDDEDCKKCAITVVSYYKNVSSDMERIKQLELKEEKEKKALKQKVEKEIKKKKDLERMQKKLVEKEARRRKWEEEQLARYNILKRRKKEVSSEESFSFSDKPKETEIRSFSFFSYGGVLMISLIAVMVVTVGVKLYCQENLRNDECIAIRDCTNHYKQIAGYHLKAMFEKFKMIYQYGSARFQDLG